MHGLSERLKELEGRYSGKVFREVVEQVKKDKINDDALLAQIESISLGRFKEKVQFKPGIAVGNLIAASVTIAAIFLAFKGSGLMLYISAFILMAALHPLSHYVTGALFGIRFTHYYLNGPAKFEPTLRIDYFSYLKVSPGKRALMHVSGVIGTTAAPLIVALAALNRDASIALNLFILFLLLIVFELLTSTKKGDLMRTKREYGFKQA